MLRILDYRLITEMEDDFAAKYTLDWMIAGIAIKQRRQRDMVFVPIG